MIVHNILFYRQATGHDTAATMHEYGKSIEFTALPLRHIVQNTGNAATVEI